MVLSSSLCASILASAVDLPQHSVRVTATLSESHIFSLCLLVSGLLLLARTCSTLGKTIWIWSWLVKFVPFGGIL